MIRSRRIGWAGHVYHMGEERTVYRILMEKPEGKRPLEDLDIGGKIILKCTLQRYDGVVWTGLICHRKGISGGLL
jgi:hypothetical protein